MAQTSRPPAITKIEEFAPMEKDYIYRYGQYYIIDNLSPVRFTAMAKNTSKYSTKTSGLFKITSNDKSIHLQGLIANNLLANSSRLLTGSPSGELVFKPSITNIGKYQATIDIKSDNSSSQNSITLIILPIKVFFFFFAGLLLLIVISKLKLKHELK
ncbi:hypothetical protein HYS10_01340 [Candidatus Collierbacteria bacterium]|nr:hypothetical protein [Candidatus Collierbacteria bacterium]